MSALPIRTHSTPPSPAGSGDPNNFDWSQLNTPRSTLTPFTGKTDRSLQLSCTKKLRTLDSAPDQPEGLVHLITGTRAIIAQKWKMLLVYFDRDDDYPNYVGLWSHVVWRKWSLVEFLTEICCQYDAEVAKAKADGVELVTKNVDGEYLGLVRHIAQLGTGGENVIAIREWERPGTKLTMESRSLVVEDLEDEAWGGEGEGEEQWHLECAEMEVDEEAEVIPLKRASTGGLSAGEIVLPMRLR